MASQPLSLPTPRSSTPTAPRSAAGSLTQKSSVVPFVRPNSSTANDEFGPGSANHASLPSSLRAARAARSLSNNNANSASQTGSARVTPSSSLRRPTWRGSPAVAAVAPPAVRVSGFDAETTSSTTTTTTSAHVAHAPTASSGASGLLSRVLHVREGPASASKKSLFSTSTSSSEVPQQSPVEVDADALYERLQASHPIFRSPLVRQAWAVAKVAHRGQARSAAAPSQPLLEHCAAVAEAVAELLSGDAEAVAAAVLHEALGRGVATAGALREVGVPERVVALVSSVARMSDLCAVRRFTTGEASSSPSGSPVGSLGGGGVGVVGSTSTTTAAATAAPAAAPPPPKADSSAFVAMLLSMSDVRAVVIKLADRLCDLKSSAAAAVAEAEKHVAAVDDASSSSLSSSSKPSLEARRAVADPTTTTFPSAVAARDAARDALSLYAPLANRLGVWSLKASLEDAAFALLHPAEADALAAALAPPERAAASLQRALDALRAKLDEVAAKEGGGGKAGASSGLANADLSGRPKNLYGVHRKLLAKGPGATPASVHDARAVRVLVPAKADCYAALRAVHALWKPADEDQPFKDYIRRPKDNGYQSLHTVVLVEDEETGEVAPLEVQIRTAKMHLVAEFGVAAHWRYKEESASAASEANEALATALAATGAGTAATTAKNNNGENTTSTSSFDADDDAPLSSSDFEDAQVAWARWLITWAHELEDKKAKASKSGSGGEGRVGGAGSAGPLAALAGAVGSAVPVAASSSSSAAASSSRSHHHHHNHSSTCAFPTHSADCAFVDFMANTLNGRSSSKKDRERDREGAAAARAAAASSVSSPSSTVATASAVADVAASSSAAATTSSSERVLVAVLDHTASGDGPAIPRVEAVPAGTTAAQLAARLAARSTGGNATVAGNGSGSSHTSSNGRPPSASSAAAYRASRAFRTRVLVNNGELALSVQGGVATLEEDLDDGRNSFDGDDAAARAAASLSAALKPGDKVELFFVPAGGPTSFDGSESNGSGGNNSHSRGGSIDIEVERVRLARLFSADVAARAAQASAV